MSNAAREPDASARLARVCAVTAHGSATTPFMPGYLVHSLTNRGVSMAAASAVSERLATRLVARRTVSTEELREWVCQALGQDPYCESESERSIEVLGSRYGLPFSKGVLLQSLLAGAIDPPTAFRVARRIELELDALRVARIEGAELRHRVAESLEHHVSPEAARRYLVWRDFGTRERPLIILLGGTSGVGKTTIALELARRLEIGRVLSTDSIRQVMRIMVSKELVPSIHGSSYNAHKLIPATKGERRSMIRGFREQAAAVAVGVHACLERAITESAHLVIDGVSLVPGLVDVDRYRDAAHIVSFIVSTEEDAALRDRFGVRAVGQKRRLPHRYLDHFDAILEIQQHLVAQARRHGVPVIDNQDFERTMRQLIEHVVDGLPPIAGEA